MQAFLQQLLQSSALILKFLKLGVGASQLEGPGFESQIAGQGLSVSRLSGLATFV